MMRSVLLTCSLALAAGTVPAGEIVVENASARLVLGSDGCARSLVEKASGEDLLLPGVRVPFATLTQDRPYDNEYKLMLPAKPWTHKSNRIERRGDELRIGFEDEFDTLVLKIRETPDYLGFTLDRIDYDAPDFGFKRKTEIDGLTVLRLPFRRRAHFGATLNVTWDGTVAASVLASDCETRVEAEEAFDGGLLFWAGTEPRVGLRRLSAALVVRPQPAFLDSVAAFERDSGLPRGVESRRHRDIAEACYFVPLFRPEDLDRHLAAARAGGFRLFMLDIHNLVRTIGTYEPLDCYPNGLADFAAIGDRIRAAGLQVALHGYPTKVQRNDPLATTNLDARLNAACDFVFARDLTADATDLLVEGNAGLLRKEDNRRLLAAGRELIEFKAAEPTAVPGQTRLAGCTRGARGTAPAAHAKGERLRHLDVDDWPIWIRADPHTTLLAEMADRINAIWKAFGAVMFYFDGAEDVPPPYWHHVPRAQLILYERLDPKPLYCETALKSHFGWHINSRGNAFDVFAPERIRAAMEACNLRCAAQDADDFSCVDFGWLSLRPPERNPKGEETGCYFAKNVNLGIGMQPDHFEYVFAKALAWNGPVTVQFTVKWLQAHPHGQDDLTAMRRWNEARRDGRFTAAERAALKDPAAWHFLLDFGGGRTELVAAKQATADAERPIRAFSFARGAETGLVYWDIFSAETPRVELSGCGEVRHLADGGRRIILAKVPEADLVRAFRSQVVTGGRK